MAESRAILLLQRELYHLQRNPLWGVSVELIRNSLLEWSVRMEGLQDGEWAGAVFQLELYFDESFDSYPPSVQFMTVPFHPNIDMESGVPCTDILQSSWFSSGVDSVRHLLLFLQQLLNEPVLEDCVNPTASAIYSTAPRLYHQLAQDCIVASRRIAAGLEPFATPARSEADGNQVKAVKPTTAYQAPVPVKVSFEEYYQQWSKRGTSRSDYKSKDFVKNFHNFASTVSGRGQGCTKELLDMAEKQRQLWYGRLVCPRAPENNSSIQSNRSVVKPNFTQKSLTRDEKLAKLRKMYGINSDADSRGDASSPHPVTKLPADFRLSTPMASRDALYDSRNDITSKVKVPFKYHVTELQNDSSLYSENPDGPYSNRNLFPQRLAIFAENSSQIRGRSLSNSRANKKNREPSNERRNASDFPTTVYDHLPVTQLLSANSAGVLSDTSGHLDKSNPDPVFSPSSPYTALPLQQVSHTKKLADAFDEYISDDDNPCDDLVAWSQNLGVPT